MTDTHLGLSLDEEHRLVVLHVTDGTDAWGIEVFRTLCGSAFHRLVVPGAGGLSTTRDMARFYAALDAGGAIDSARIMQPETVERMLTIEVDEDRDPTFDVPVRRRLGFELGGRAAPPAARAESHPHGSHLLARWVRLLRLLGRP
jgi:CubicO group peptidase (beta-lactamase class C family)